VPDVPETPAPLKPDVPEVPLMPLPPLLSERVVPSPDIQSFAIDFLPKKKATSGNKQAGGLLLSGTTNASGTSMLSVSMGFDPSNKNRSRYLFASELQNWKFRIFPTRII
jgi:hypothetical protein